MSPGQRAYSLKKYFIQPTVEEADDDLKDHIYPVTAATQSQKKNLEAKKFQPTSRVTKPAGRNSERLLAHQASRNQDRLNNTTRSPSLSPPPFEDEEMEDSATIRGDSYGMRGALHPGQNRQVQFEDQDDGVYDIPESRHYQKKTLSLPRPQQAEKVQDDCFQTEPFFETSVPLPIWQRLDQSPQSKVQLARAIASTWLPKREERPARPNLVGTAAVALKSWTQPAIEPVAHKDKEGYDQLLLKRWMCKVDWGPGAKTIWGRSIPEILPLINDRLVHLDGFNPAEIMLEFEPKRKTIGGHTPELLKGVIQGEVEELEESPKGLLIGRMMNQKRRNSELLWSDRYRKITRHMKGVHKLPNRILMAESDHPSLLVF